MSKQDKGKEPMGDKADSVALSKYLSKANMQELASLARKWQSDKCDFVSSQTQASLFACQGHDIEMLNAKEC